MPPKPAGRRRTSRSGSQLAATFGRDLTVDNRFREEGRVNLRLLQVF